MNWNLKVLFSSEEEYQNAFEEVKKISQGFSAYEGKLNDISILHDFIVLQESFEMKLYPMISYASLNYNLNMKDMKNAARMGELSFFLQNVSQSLSFMNPELIQIGRETLEDFCKKDAKIHEYSHMMDSLFSEAEHILSKKEENLLANFQPVVGRGELGNLYDALCVNDKINKTITLSTGEATVTNGNWSSLILNAPTEEDRKKIFEALYSHFDEHKATLAGIYEYIMKSSLANARSRNYSSILESYLKPNHIDTKVFLNLIDTAREESEPLKRYVQLRKKLLKLEEYHTYDRFLSFSNTTKEYSYEEAKDLFFESVKEMPSNFQEKAHIVLEDGYVDVYEKDGKQTGAFSSGMYGLHPYILLNHDKTLESVFTIAHEAGHSIHTLYSNEAQPLATADYVIFVAEIASTFNEQMLLDAMMKKAETKEEKIALLEHGLNSIVGTFHRQALFANYEYEANQLVEQGKPINHEVLSSIMVDLYQKYYGLDITKEGLKQYVWAYIPHFFHTPFYVYQYATSFSASMEFYDRIKNHVPGALEGYITLLQSGGSDYPVELVKKAGVDLTTKKPFEAVNKRMTELLDELEKLVDNQ